MKSIYFILTIFVLNFNILYSQTNTVKSSEVYSTKAMDHTDISEWKVEVGLTYSNKSKKASQVLQVVIYAPNNLYGGNDILVAMGNVIIDQEKKLSDKEEDSTNCKNLFYKGDHFQHIDGVEDQYCFTSLITTPRLHELYSIRKAELLNRN